MFVDIYVCLYIFFSRWYFFGIRLLVANAIAVDRVHFFMRMLCLCVCVCVFSRNSLLASYKDSAFIHRGVAVVTTLVFHAVVTMCIYMYI